MTDPRRPRSREDYERGLPDHHDPTAGFAGAPPARSALTLRLVLAAFGLLVCGIGGLVLLAVEAVPVALPVVVLLFAAIAAVDIVVVLRRKARGEPG